MVVYGKVYRPITALELSILSVIVNCVIERPMGILFSSIGFQGTFMLFLLGGTSFISGNFCLPYCAYKVDLGHKGLLVV